MSRTHLQPADSEPPIWRCERVWVTDILEISHSKTPSCLSPSFAHLSFFMNLWMKLFRQLTKKVTWLCFGAVLEENPRPWILSLRVLLNSIKLMSFDAYVFCLCLIFFVQPPMRMLSNAFQGKWRLARNFQLHLERTMCWFLDFYSGNREIKVPPVVNLIKFCGKLR